LQPDWGRRWGLTAVWVAVVALFCVIVGLGFVGSIGLAQWLPVGKSPDWIGVVIACAGFGTLADLVFSPARSSQHIEPMERIYWSWVEFRREAPWSVPAGALVGALVGALFGGVYLAWLRLDQTFGGLVLGLLLGTAGGSVLAGLGSRVLESHSRPNQDRRLG